MTIGKPKNKEKHPTHKTLKHGGFLTNSRFSKFNLVVFALIFAGIGSYLLFSSRAATTCTTTVSDLASVVSQSSSAANGSTICITDGSYGALNLTAARSGYVTIAAANGFGHVTLSGLTVSCTAAFLHLDGLKITNNSIFGGTVNSGCAPHDMQVTNSDSLGWDVEAGGQNYMFDHDSTHDGPYGWMLNGSVKPWPGGCCNTANYPFIKNVTIQNSTVTRPGADAFQVKGFDGVTITHNDIYNVVQNGGHNDGIQTVHGGQNLTITHNVWRDGNIELWMIKDGTICSGTSTEAQIQANNTLCSTSGGNNIMSDNLMFNNNSANNPPCGCGTSVTGQLMGPINWKIEHNTNVQPGMAVTNNPTLVGNGNPNYLIPVGNEMDHNVMNNYRPTDSTSSNNGAGIFTNPSVMNEHDNIFNTWTRNWISGGPGTTFNDNPIFKCSPNCGSGAGQSEDYELANNPNGIGIDWNPVGQVYGPQTSGPNPPPTATISANPTTISTGSSSTLTWSSTNATDCTASGGWSGSKATSGTQSVSPTVTTTYTLTCSGAGGTSAPSSATVTVNNSNPPPTVTFSASPVTINLGSNSILAWSSTNATSCTASNNINDTSWSGSKATSGTQSVSPTTNVIYSLICTGPGGNSPQANVTVTVNIPNGCYQSSTSWTNNSFTAQTSNFTFDFDATPAANNINSVNGLSNGAAAGYGDLAAVARFNTSGNIDALNGTGYAAAATVPYTSGTSYHFKMTVNPTAHTYSVVVTPSGGSATTIAADYAFRTTQATLGTFSNWALYQDPSSVGGQTVCNAVAATISGGVVGDINKDGSVNVFDLSLLLSSFGSNTSACVTAPSYTCDLNSDNTINVFDLSILLSHYGT